MIILPSLNQFLLLHNLYVQLSFQYPLEFFYSFTFKSDKFGFNEFGYIFEIDRRVSDFSFRLEITSASLQQEGVQHRRDKKGLT